MGNSFAHADMMREKKYTKITNIRDNQANKSLKKLKDISIGKKMYQTWQMYQTLLLRT